MRFSPRILAIALLGATAAISAPADAATIVSECNSRLPMSLSTVVSDLEAEGVSSVSTATFVTSRGVPKRRQATVLGLEDASSTSFGTDAGVCLALCSQSSSSIAEVASTAVACEGNIVFYPDQDDLARGEGLFDSLAPAMERLLNEEDTENSSRRKLIVVSPNQKATQRFLEAAADDVLSYLVSVKKNVKVLGDVFDDIHYVESIDEAMDLLKPDKEPAVAQELIASTVASDFWQTTPVSFSSSSMSARDLAAARKLGPAARKAFDNAVETVKSVADGKIVTDFADLCSAATKRALEELDEAATPALSSSVIGKQIRADLKEELSGAFADLAATQMELLKEACFVDFKGKLSKLRLTPNLPSDMQNAVKESVSEFTKASKKMPIGNADAKVSFQRRLQEFCAERLLAARASGQFRPLPRKGVQIGLHWLLPKPFGNDYRQEPWMVHATDNLVYVPPDKMTDVSPGDVATGDWRNSVVPSPAGNEIIYMQ